MQKCNNYSSWAIFIGCVSVFILVLVGIIIDNLVLIIIGGCVALGGIILVPVCSLISKRISNEPILEFDGPTRHNYEEMV